MEERKMAGLITHQGISEPAWSQLSARAQSFWRGASLCVCILTSAVLVVWVETWTGVVLSAVSLVASQFVLETQRRLGTIQSAIVGVRLQTSLVVGGTVVVAVSGLAIFCAIAYAGAIVMRVLLSVPIDLPHTATRIMSPNLLIVVSSMMIGRVLFKFARDMRLPVMLWETPMLALRRVFVEQRWRATNLAELILMEYACVVTVYGWAVFVIQWMTFLGDIDRTFAI
jgi:hypothetical protein